MANQQNIQSDKIVYGLFETRAALENAVGRLKAEGFLSSDISALWPAAEGSREFTPEAASDAPEGDFLGGALGWLAGIGALTIPGLGPFVAAGPILATLGNGAISSQLGGIASALTAIGVPEFEAIRFENSVSGGCLLLSVHAGQADWDTIALDIFRECGAHDIATTESTHESLLAKQRGPAPEKRF